MGVFDFIKSVGEKLGIGGDDDSPDAEALKKEVEKHGLEAEGLKVEVDGDTTFYTVEKGGTLWRPIARR